jgi:hypothetical protein
MDRASPRRCRHVWVDTDTGGQHPGLVLEWRKTRDGWEAQVAVVRTNSVLTTWIPATALHPVADDRWG